MEPESVPSLGDLGWWPIGFFLRRSGQGRVSSEKLGDLCAAAPSLHADPMPPRMTQESCRPRVSDRTMVGNSATRLACEFQRTEGAVMSANMKTTGRKKHPRPVAPRPSGPLRDGAKRSSSCRRNVATGAGGWMSKKYSCRSGGDKCFSLDIPFILLAHVVSVDCVSRQRSAQRPHFPRCMVRRRTARDHPSLPAAADPLERRGYLATSVVGVEEWPVALISFILVPVLRPRLQFSKSCGTSCNRGRFVQGRR